MKIRIIYNHDIFSTQGRLTKGDIVDLPEEEATLYFDRDWAMPCDEPVTVGDAESVDDEEFEEEDEEEE